MSALANGAMRLFLLAWLVSGLTSCAEKSKPMDWQAMLDEAGVP